jgi:hypothetical protein
MHRFLSIGVLALLAWNVSLSSARAQSNPPPDSIEEDWKVVIGTPDPVGAGPQISTSMSPVTDGSSPFSVFDLNYQDSPTFVPGGMQVQIWSGDQMLNATTKGTAQCSTTGETITWTQSMSLSSGSISFGINSGKSTTWGKFGQGQQLNVSGSFTTSLTSLSQYSPDTSVTNSGVGWQPNRVTSMTLLQVRYYAGGKLLSKETTPRTINLSN